MDSTSNGEIAATNMNLLINEEFYSESLFMNILNWSSRADCVALWSFK